MQSCRAVMCIYSVCIYIFLYKYKEKLGGIEMATQENKQLKGWMRFSEFTYFKGYFTRLYFKMLDNIVIRLNEGKLLFSRLMVTILGVNLNLERCYIFAHYNTPKIPTLEFIKSNVFFLRVDVACLYNSDEDYIWRGRRARRRCRRKCCLGKSGIPRKFPSNYTCV